MRAGLHPEADAEFGEAARWYDEQLAGLGSEFVREVMDTITRLQEAPEQFPLWPGVHQGAVPIRRALLKRFPYALAFEVHGAHIVVLAVAHTKRRSLYWRSRAT